MIKLYHQIIGRTGNPARPCYLEGLAAALPLARPGNNRIAFAHVRRCHKMEMGGVMAARLTDKQKKMLIADYIELGSYNAVAKKHGVSDKTVKNVVTSNPDFSRKSEEKKQQNTADILAHMETKRDKVNEIIDVYLEKLLDKEMLAKATPSQITTALGTLIDKFTMRSVTDHGMSREEDPLSKALREEAERMMKNADQS